MASFACQQRPSAPLAPANKCAAVFPLSISIVVVAAPAGAEWSVHLQHGVHNFQRINDDWIVGPADSMTHQFQKTGIHDFFGRKYALRTGRKVRNGDVSLVGIFVGNRIVCLL